MKDQGTFKNEKLKDKQFDVARTRKCVECGSEEEISWLALHPRIAERRWSIDTTTPT